MHILTDLLDTYSKLRKRRYSLSEALLGEQGGSRELSLNREFPEGSYEEKDLQSLLHTAKSPATGGISADNIGLSPFIGTSTEDPGMVAWRDYQGNKHSASQDTLIQYLELRLKDEDEAGLEAEDLGAEDPAVMEMPVLHPEAQNILGLAPRIEDLANDPALNIPDKDGDLKERARLLVQGIADKIENRMTPGVTLWSQQFAGIYELEGEDFGEEAIKEFVDDFGSFLSILSDAAKNEGACFEVGGRQEREKILNRFFTRGGTGQQSKLMYGSLTSDAEKPLMSAGIQTEKLKDHSSVNRYQGTHFTGRLLSSSPGVKVSNPLFDIIDAVRKVKKCDSGEQLISSTGSAGGSDWPTIRSRVDETAPLIANAFVDWVELSPSRKKERLGGEITAALRLSIGAIESRTNKFIEFVRDAHGSFDGIEKMYPDVVADAEEFLEHAFGDKVLEGLVTDKDVKKLAVLTVASYMIPELEVAAELRSFPGFVGMTNQFGGVTLNKLTGYVDPSRLPHGGNGSERAEKFKGDSALVFKDKASAERYLQGNGSTHTSSRQRLFQEDPQTGYYLIPREHKNPDPRRGEAHVQFGRDAISPKGLHSLASNQVFETHLNALQEKNVSPQDLNRVRAARRRSISNSDRVRKALASPVKPPGVDPAAYLRDPNTLDSLLGDLQAARANCTFPQNDQISDVIDRLERYQRDPNGDKQRRNKEGLFTETWHTFNRLNGDKPASPKEIEAAAAMDFLMGGASTAEKMISFRVGSRGDMLMIPQSVLFDDLATELTTGTGIYNAKTNSEGIEVVADPKGFKMYRGGRESGKNIVEVRYRARGDGGPGSMMEVSVSPSEMVRRSKGRRGGLGESRSLEIKALIRETIVEVFEEMFIRKA